MSNINDIDYADLYGVRHGEIDFSGAIERSLNDDIKHLDEEFLEAIIQYKEGEQDNYLLDKETRDKLSKMNKEYLEVKQWMEERQKSKDPEIRKALKEKINNYFNTHHDGYEAFHKDNYIQNQTHELILEYNRRMRDDVNYPNKDQVRLWYSCQSQMLINEDAFSFSFLYPDFMGSIEELEKIYKKIN